MGNSIEALHKITPEVYSFGTRKEQDRVDAYRLHGTSRKAADALGVTKSTINNAVNSILAKADVTTLYNKPKVLVFDIETAPNLSHHWGLWQQNIGLNMMVRDWFVLSWSAKWLGNDEVMYDDIRDKFTGTAHSVLNDVDDSSILESIWQLLNEADIVITQNGIKFDVKKLNARFIMNGMKPTSSFKHIDTLRMAKAKFAFTSNKLEFMTDKLCKKYKKLTHGKFAGFSLWKECLLGNVEAWDEMETYNRYDVLSLEELYYIMSPWDSKQPNFNLYQNSTENVCNCGSTDIKPNGYAYTGVSRFIRLTCQSCGSESRERDNTFSKGKRKSITMNVMG